MDETMLLYFLLLLLSLSWFSWQFRYISQRTSCTQEPDVSRTYLTIFEVVSIAAFLKSSMLLFTSKFFSQSQSFQCHSQGSNYKWNNCDLGQLLDLFHFPPQFDVIVYFFLFFQLNPFVPRHSNIDKVTLSFRFVQHNYVRPSVLNGMI